MAEGDFTYCDPCYHCMVCPSVFVSSVTLMHPAKAIGQNEMPFGRDTRVILHNIVLDTGTSCHRLIGRGDLGIGTPSL